MLDDLPRWVIGEQRAGTNTYVAIKLEPIQTGQRYGLEVILSGDTATLQECRVAKV